MKSTGIVRRVDELGRIVLPIEIRRNFNLDKGDAVEIFVDDETVVLRKYAPACIFCGSADNEIPFKGRTICEKCLAELQKVNGDGSDS